MTVDNQVVGPHGRLGLAWALVTLGALLGGPLWLALWLAPTAGVASIQAARSWRPRRHPSPALAGVGAASMVLAAVAGPQALAAVGATVLVATVAGRGLWSLTAARRQPRKGAVRARGGPVHVSLTVVIALWMGAAAAGPVILRRGGLVTALVLLTFAAVYDTGAYLVGTGANAAWEGPAAGIAAIGAVTLAVAAFLVPPFNGATPWGLGALAAATAPLGPLAGSALLGGRGRGTRVPFVRRLDSLLVLAPVWSAAASALLD